MLCRILAVLSGVVFLGISGCHIPSVYIGDISTEPEVRIHSSGVFSVQPGSLITASAHQVVLNCRLSKDNEVLITGDIVFSDSDSVAQRFDLKALGFPPGSAGS